MERKLAVILVADIVGYSAQMERDEAGTYTRVTERRREIFEPAIARHQGRVFKLVGDGLLAEFGSAVQAVECAISLQTSLAERNLDVAEEQRVLARIGINLGEVIVDGDDRLGEGVNIAARLEQLAEPGGICVSEKVAREVERKLAFGFESMGVKRVKNIAEPIHVYRVSADASQGPRQRVRAFRPNRRTLMVVAALIAALVGATLWLGRPASPVGPPVVAVLPFTNLSGDPTQDYLGAGIAEDIIAMLSTSPLIRVLSKSSSFTVASATDPQTVAQALQADYILEGSLRRHGDAFQISTQLVDGRDGRNLWAKRLEQDGSNIVAMQEAIASQTYATLAGLRGEVVELEQAKTWSRSAPSLEEYDFHLRGAFEFLKWTPEAKQAAFEIWTEGLEQFPESSLLRLELAALHNNRAVDGLTDDPWGEVQQAMALISEAEADPTRSRMEDWLLHYVKATTLIAATGDHQAAALEAELAHDLAPYDPLSSVDLSLVMTNAGHPEVGIAWAEYAVANERVVPDWYRGNLAWAYLMAGRTADALAIYEDLKDYCAPCKASALVRAGRLDEAKGEVSAYKAWNPSWTVQTERTFPTGRTVFMVRGQMEPYIADLRKAGLK